MIQGIQEPSDGVYKRVSTSVDNWLRWHQDDDFTIDEVKDYYAWNEKLTLQALSKKLYYESHKPKPVLRKRRRFYRVINRELEPMDLKKADPANILHLSWPFGLERYAVIYRKNVAILGGSKSAGKTAFVLDFIRRNMANHTIKYFNSEMGESELYNRMLNFDGISPEEWRFYPYMKSSDFAEAIDPDVINVIDFLEIHKDFWEVGAFIHEIWERLDKGMALIVIQKNEGAEYPLGGQRALEKARLVLNMDKHAPMLAKHHLLTIKDCKNWADKENSPNGLQWTFKLVGGAKFVDVAQIS